MLKKNENNSKTPFQMEKICNNLKKQSFDTEMKFCTLFVPNLKPQTVIYLKIILQMI